MAVMTLNVNGTDYTFDCDPSTPLLWVLRDIIGLTGTKYGCGVEICQACLVWVDGSGEKSCDESVGEVLGRRITTIEGLRDASPVGAAVQDAFIEAQAPQCGFCQSGMIMRATRLVQSTPQPTDAQIDSAMRNICACGTYPRVKEAIKIATGQA